jgi:4-amino-4-deoxy-L-arabinose transferase-like glycosyltransferase
MPSSFLAAVDRVMATRPYVVIGLYFLLHALLRSALPVAPGFDDAAEFVSTQTLAGGYSAQPPLYTWLVWLVFQFTGPSLPALVALKNVQLFLTFALIGRIARRVGASESLAVTVLFGVFLIIQIAWRSQFSLTHTIVAVLMSVLFTERFLALVERRRLVDYVAIGLVFGLGCSAKYNFPILPLALMLAALTVPAGRRALATPALLLTLAAAGLAFAPHGVWLVGHLDVATSNSGRLQLMSGPMARVYGLTDLAAALIAFAGPLVLVHGLIWWRFRRAAGERTPFAGGDAAERRRLLARALLLALAAIVVGLLASGSEQVADHWLQTVFFALPALTTAALAARVPAAALVWSRRAAAVVMVAVTLIIPLACLPHPSAAGWRAVAAALRAEAPGLRTVISNDLRNAGRLKRAAPELILVDTELKHLPVAAPAPAVLMWTPAPGAATPPEALLALAAARLGRGGTGPVRTLIVPSWIAGRRDQPVAYAVYRPE